MSTPLVPRADSRYPPCPCCGRPMRCDASGPNDLGSYDVSYSCVKGCLPTPEALDIGSQQHECEGLECVGGRKRFCSPACADMGA